MPFAWVVIVILWVVISSISKNAKQQNQNSRQAGQQAVQRKAAPQRPAQQPQRQAQPPKAAPQPAAPAMSRSDDWDDEEENWDQRDAQRAQPAPAPRPAPAKRHETKPLEAHMHTPVMGVEGDGTEGIDCCHEYMLGDSAAGEPADFLPMQEEGETARAKALLQGVIYSEILGRRPVKHYGKRPA